MSEHVVIVGTRVLLDGGLHAAAIRVEGGRIARVDRGAGADRLGETPGWLRIDAGDRVVMPGVIDTHVHVNDPGRAEWEGFETATRAAAAGGVTTIVDMPLNSSPVTTTPGAVRAKSDAACGRLRVDAGLWGGLVPENARTVEALLDAGVLGIKAFLVDSGIDEFPAVGERELEPAMRVLARRGLPLLAHAEDPGVIARAPVVTMEEARSYAAYLRSRPPEAEVASIALLAELCRRTGCRVHVVHLATDLALDVVRAAKRDGLALTVETCPHYLTFTAEDIPDGATRFKCAPPIRGRSTREALWAALLEGLIDQVSSDHSPCPPAMKGEGAGDFTRAWGGIASVQLLLSAAWTGASGRGASIADVSRWLSAAPAKLAGLGGRKGRIAPGYDADIVLFDPEASFTVRPEMILHRHTLTPYEGLTLRGRVERTLVRGVTVYERGRVAPGATGELILAGDRK